MQSERNKRFVGVSESSHVDSLREAQSLKQSKSLEEGLSSITLSVNQIVSIFNQGN